MAKHTDKTPAGADASPLSKTAPAASKPSPAKRTDNPLHIRRISEHMRRNLGDCNVSVRAQIVHAEYIRSFLERLVKATERAVESDGRCTIDEVDVCRTILADPHMAKLFPDTQTADRVAYGTSDVKVSMEKERAELARRVARAKGKRIAAQREETAWRKENRRASAKERRALEAAAKAADNAAAGKAGKAAKSAECAE
jgi:histone H3/H4